MAGEYLFEVRHISLLGDKFTVNLETKECSCRQWMLTGLPCCHAMSAMKDRNLDPETYIPVYYRKEAYEAVYQPILHPVNGQNLWESTPYPDVQPPPIRKMPGRPKKKRNIEAAELEEGTLMSRRGFGIKCSRCKESGHNKTTCKLPPPCVPDQPAPSATTTTATASASATAPTTTASASASATAPTTTASASAASATATASARATASAPKRQKLRTRRAATATASANNAAATATASATQGGAAAATATSTASAQPQPRALSQPSSTAHQATASSQPHAYSQPPPAHH